MKLYTKNTGSNYLAQIVTLPKPEKHPNADKLQVVKIQGSTIIVGLNAKEGDQYILFPLETAINHKFLAFTNSFSDPLRNADGKTKGFFNDKGRVRAVKLRGTPSEGYLCPLEQFQAWADSLAGILSPDLPAEPGKEFDTLEYTFQDGNNGTTVKEELICQKYIPFQQQAKGPANQPKKDKTKRFDRMIPGQFHFHIDTAQLKKNIHLISPEDVITIGYKMHGTNFVCGNLLVKRKLSLKERIAKFFGCSIVDAHYDILYSSRQVLKNAYLYDDSGPNHYYKQDIWGDAKEVIKNSLEKGITVYAEIVGQLKNGSWVQKGYDYGTKPCEFGVYVFRITHTNPDGIVTEYTTRQVQNYCQSHNLNMVPIEFHGKAKEYLPYNGEANWNELFLNKLKEDHLEKPCKMCKNNVPGEGIVLSKESSTPELFKLKSYSFLVGETEALDKGDIGIDIEEVA